jgi:hypothetical protein
MSNNEILAELLRLTRQTARQHRETEFSVSKLLAGVCQGVAVLALALGLIRFLPVYESVSANDSYWLALGWFAAAGVLQLMALTFHTISRQD